MLSRPVLSAVCRRTAARSRAPRVSISTRSLTDRTTSIAARKTISSSSSSSSPPILLRAFSSSQTVRNEVKEASADDTAVQAGIAKAVKTSPVVLFMKGTPEMPQCGFSRATVQILGLQGVDPAKFTAFNVLEDSDLRQGIKKYSDWPTIPQLYVDGEFVGGCDILMSMHQDGSLAQLLGDKGVIVEGEADSTSETKA